MTKISFNFKTITIQLIFFIGLFITLYSGVVLILLRVFSSVVPIELPSFMWISDVNQFYSILVFIGIIFLGLGVILFFLLTKKKERIPKEIELDPTQIKWFMNAIKIILIIGSLLIFFTISDIMSVILFTNTSQFSLAQIGEQIQRFTTVYFFLLIGIYLFIIGVLLFRKNMKLNAKKTEVELIKMFSKRNRYFYVNSMVIGILFLLLFGRSIPFILNRLLNFLPWPDPYAIRYLSNLRIIIFNIFLGILLIIYGLLCFILRKRNLEKSPKILKTSKHVEKRKKIVGIIGIGIGIMPNIFTGFPLILSLTETIAYPYMFGFEYYYMLPLGILIAILSILLIVNGVMLLTIKAEYTIDLQFERKNVNNH